MYIRLLHLKPRDFAAICASCGVNLFLQALTSGGGDDKTEQSVRTALNRARAPLKTPAKLEEIREKIDEAMTRAGIRAAESMMVTGLQGSTQATSQVVPAAALTAVFGHLTMVEQHSRDERQETLNALKAANEAGNNAQKFMANVAMKAIDALSPQKPVGTETRDATVIDQDAFASKVADKVNKVISAQSTALPPVEGKPKAPPQHSNGDKFEQVSRQLFTPAESGGNSAPSDFVCETVKQEEETKKSIGSTTAAPAVLNRALEAGASNASSTRFTGADASGVKVAQNVDHDAETATKSSVNLSRTSKKRMAEDGGIGDNNKTPLKKRRLIDEGETITDKDSKEPPTTPFGSCANLPTFSDVVAAGASDNGASAGFGFTPSAGVSGEVEDSHPFGNLQEVPESNNGEGNEEEIHSTSVVMFEQEGDSVSSRGDGNARFLRTKGTENPPTRLVLQVNSGQLTLVNVWLDKYCQARRIIGTKYVQFDYIDEGNLCQCLFKPKDSTDIEPFYDHLKDAIGTHVSCPDSNDISLGSLQTLARARLGEAD
ncbi:hypothetical protein THAOC_01113 [Thalassiosira oceanica]|uniref:Uncharacterized protein n=1 Tax=Thalassiosira oceanica TaxID=159749 RepID=K0TR29_THAOC|nr:hypothetical protein THAOC_01113 [Thalassiosira oceanica]|eukprot:EJK77077.1 hypothetical protein THAOC_01113 [Thalassiosira oceanica]